MGLFICGFADILEGLIRLFICGRGTVLVISFADIPWLRKKDRCLYINQWTYNTLKTVARNKRCDRYGYSDLSPLVCEIRIVKKLT